jgi:hypothetical protein
VPGEPTAIGYVGERLKAFGTALSSVCAARSGILISWLRKKSAAGREYARPNIGASITRENNANGVLPTPEPGTRGKQGQRGK